MKCPTCCSENIAINGTKVSRTVSRHFTMSLNCHYFDRTFVFRFCFALVQCPICCSGNIVIIVTKLNRTASRHTTLLHCCLQFSGTFVFRSSYALINSYSCYSKYIIIIAHKSKRNSNPPQDSASFLSPIQLHFCFPLLFRSCEILHLLYKVQRDYCARRKAEEHPTT